MSHQILNTEIILALAIGFVPLLVLITVIILAAISLISEHRKGTLAKTDAELNVEPVVAKVNTFLPKGTTEDRT